MTKTTSCRSPPLDPYVRLSPHTAHERGILWDMSISPVPRSMHRGQLCAFAGYLCTVSRPSPSGPSPPLWSARSVPRREDGWGSSTNAREVSMLTWIRGHETLLWWLGALSIVMFVGTLVVLPMIV